MPGSDYQRKVDSQRRSSSSASNSQNSVNIEKTKCVSTADKRPPSQYGVAKKDFPWYVISRYVVDSTAFLTITTLLTVYALFGDDMRLLCTDKPADLKFDVVTILCIFIFAIEIILSCLGKVDYFLSFFFFLDVISTCTLILDISYANYWVSTLLSPQSNNGIASSGSDAARVGSKVARVVRVVRLVRILKIYKAVLHASKAKSAKNSAASLPDIDDVDDIETARLSDNDDGQTRVGKKLSDLTTRRAICLVLVMMVLLPELDTGSSVPMPRSPEYAANVVHQSFKEWDRTNLTESQQNYNRALLSMIYFHNWYNTKNAKCPSGSEECSSDYLSHLFWFGIESVQADNLVDKTRSEKLKLDPHEVDDFNEEAASQRTVYAYGSMPSQVLYVLKSRWDTPCESDSPSRNKQLGISIIDEKIPGLNSYPVKCPKDLRFEEQKGYRAFLETQGSFKEWHFVFFFDQRPFVKQEALFSLFVTIYVCIALSVAALAFNHDVNVLVLKPIESMITKVNIIRNHPLKATKMSENEFITQEVEKTDDEQVAHTLLSRLYGCIKYTRKEKHKELLETVILEKTIVKLGSLLALGLGPAGTAVIERNMLGTDSASVDAMVEGICIECIIGMIRIRDFAVVTEVFQANVMSFVNQIAEIVHGIVDECSGAVSSNDGDTFLSIWKTSDLQAPEIRKKADMAVLAVAKILAAIHKSSTLAKHRNHPGLSHRFGKNCRVNVSIGLHAGWAIEGVVGSEFKIDPSYLSPNLSITEGIEQATLTYRVHFLLSQIVVELCSAEIAAKCRLIDNVIITGSSSPMTLFVLDLDCLSLSPDLPRTTPLPLTAKQKFRARKFLEEEKHSRTNIDFQVAQLFTANSDLAAMRFRYTLEFTQVFNMGYQNYSQGEWEIAHRLLCRTRTMLGVEDGPSSALIRFMETFNFQAPPKWPGWRYL